jgi:hypothetical protein
MMKYLYTILITFVCMACHSQNFIMVDGSGNMITADTASASLPEPPDTAKVFTVNVGGANEPFSGLLTEIRGYWALEESSGDAIDSVGNTDLPVYGTVSYAQTGKLGNCFSFTTDGYLGNIDSYFEYDGAFSLSCWMKSSSSDANMALMTNSPTESNRGWDLYLINGTTYWNIRNNIETTSINGGGDLRNDAWHHVVATLGSDDSSKLYINGNLVDYDYSPNGVLYSATCRFRVGSRQSQYYFDGLIDEPATWNKELTQIEVDSLFDEAQYPFATQGSGGDSIRMRIIDYDERADTFRVVRKLGSYPTSRTDGTVEFAFGLTDTTAHGDTTFERSGLKDTTEYWTLWSGLSAEDIWTTDPNHDTVFIDSSDITPPDQDIGIWDTIFYYDFEDNSAPIHYDYNAFLADGWTADTQNGHANFRASDHRGPGYWVGNVPDSIVEDPQTSSKVLKLNFDDAYEDGYCGNYGRGGDSWRTIISPVTEVYLSYNVMLRPGWDWAGAGGKLGPGLNGGTFTYTSKPEYGEGFRMSAILWDHGYSSPDEEGNIGFYLYYQDQPNSYAHFMPFQDFQPEGEGLTGNYNAGGKFIYPTTDSVWYNITIRCVTNTHTGSTPNRDGILEGFINGHLVERVSGLYLISYPDIGNEINQFFMHQTFGNCPQNDEWSFFDDIVMFTYDVSVDVPRGNELSPPGRVLSLPNWPKPDQSE